MMRKFELLTSALLLALALPVHSATPDHVAPLNEYAAEQTPQIWRIDGGDMRLRFNEDLLQLFGIRVELTAAVKDSRNPQYVVFPLLPSKGLTFNAPDGGFDRFIGGHIKARGGFQLRLATGETIDLRDAVLRPSSDNPMHLDLVGPDGVTWVYVTHLMYEFLDGHRVFQVAASDLRASPALAKRVGAPDLANAYVGEVLFDAMVQSRSRESVALPKGVGPKFHGAPFSGGGVYEADVLMSTYSMSFSRCRRSDGVTNGCDGRRSVDGSTGADDGQVVFTPSATLRNSDKANTADIPWYEKFTGHTNPYGYPYPNADQHPYLIWNMYRIRDDQLEQIGASGLKHAWLTTNSGCGNPFGNHILSRNCSDTYGTSNNDDPTDLGPRIELLPATGVWGRCGSVFDPGCVGSNTQPNPNGSYGSRMIVRESQMQDDPGTTATRYWSEAWYVVQDDVDIYNTMGRRPMTPTPGSSAWIAGSQGAAMLPGPVINAWVDPVTQPARNVELRDDHGRVRVAVKVKTLDACPAGSGLSGTCYRYDYAVNNFDYAVSDTQGTLPNLRVIGAKGFDRFRIEFGMRANVHVPDSGHFADIDIDAGNDWSVSSGPNHVEWLAPAGNELDWGRLFRFSLVSTVAPVDADTVAVDLRPLNIGLAGSGLAGQIVGPAGVGESIFSDSFE